LAYIQVFARNQQLVTCHRESCCTRLE